MDGKLSPSEILKQTLDTLSEVQENMPLFERLAKNASLETFCEPLNPCDEE